MHAIAGARTRALFFFLHCIKQHWKCVELNRQAVFKVKQQVSTIWSGCFPFSLGQELIFGH